MTASSQPATVSRSAFGRTQRGEDVDRYELLLPSGASAAVLTRGATLQQVRVPDAAGVLGDVVVALPDTRAYEAAEGYPGAVVGRVGNRIAGGVFSLDGERYEVPVNDGPNALHGGAEGFDQRLWDAQEVEGGVRFSLLSRDGDMGFPGELSASVTYVLTEADGVVALQLTYGATTTAPTPLNLTNHAYVNLDGAGTVEDHVVTLNSSRYLPVDAALIPTGELADVSGTPFDFRSPTRLGDRLRDADPQLLRAGGYDHNVVLDDCLGGRTGLAATLTAPRSGRRLDVETDRPGLQFYSGNFLDGAWRTVQGRPVRQGDALCLETQGFPDAVNQPALTGPEFGEAVLRPGQEWATTTTFRFSLAR